MTPLPGPLGPAKLIAWRLDVDVYAPTWDSGIGASLKTGGRWNSPGVRVVYCSFDPATTILEAAVHKGFRALDRIAHTLTSMEILAATDIHVVDPSAVPNPNWLHPGIPTPDQQQFGDALTSAHKFVALPSVVSSESWNVIFVAGRSGYRQISQQRFALDHRLHPATHP